MKFNNNEEAVSPVIGVILMVAITVILAAVIAVFVFGMADDIQTSHTVAATAKVSNGNVLVTFQGGQDAKEVKYINATVYSDTGAPVTPVPAGTGTAVSDTIAVWTKPTVGSVMTLTGAGIQDRIVVTAEFNDGASQVLLDKKL